MLKNFLREIRRAVSGAMSCPLIYCGDSLIRCKTVINIICFSWRSGEGGGVQSEAANNWADYHSQNMVIATHLSFHFSSLRELQAFVLNKCVYHIVAF